MVIKIIVLFLNNLNLGFADLITGQFKFTHISLDERKLSAYIVID